MLDKSLKLEPGKNESLKDESSHAIKDEIHVDPSLFKVQVQRKHLDRLINDDVDEISKFEVVYKILKD